MWVLFQILILICCKFVDTLHYTLLTATGRYSSTSHQTSKKRKFTIQESVEDCAINVKNITEFNEGIEKLQRICKEKGRSMQPKIIVSEIEDKNISEQFTYVDGITLFVNLIINALNFRVQYFHFDNYLLLIQ